MVRQGQGLISFIKYS